MSGIEPTVLTGLIVSGGASVALGRALINQMRRDTRPFELGDTGSNIILGRETYNPYLFTGQEMGVTIGSVGSGKFTSAIAPNMLSYPGSCFVIDPKGEVCAVTAQARMTKFAQTVYRLDPFDTTEFDPKSEVFPLSTFNPLDALDARSDSLVSDAGSLASAIIAPATGKADPFWKNSAAELLTALIVFVASAPETAGERHLGTVLRYLSSTSDEWETLFRKLIRSDITALQNAGKAFGALDERTRSGVIQQVRSELSFAVFPEIERTMRTSSLAMEELFKSKCTIYIVLPANRLDSHKPWLRLMVAASLMVAGRYKRAQLDVPVLWIIDEAARLGTMEEIPKAYALMRGYGVRVWSFWQDLGQMKACYPDHWSSLIGNSFVQLLSVGDFDTADYFSKLAGTHEVQKVSTSYSTSNSGQQRTSGSSKTYSMQQEAVIPPERLLHMQAWESYVRLPNQMPCLVGKLRYFEDPMLKGRAMPNPYHAD